MRFKLNYECRQCKRRFEVDYENRDVDNTEDEAVTMALALSSPDEPHEYMPVVSHKCAGDGSTLPIRGFADLIGIAVHPQERHYG